MSLQNVLEQLGLTQKEAAVYLAVLELGQSPVLRIAHKAGVKRPTAYVTLSALQEKGFMEILPKGTTTLYYAVAPERIFEKLHQKFEEFNTILPELKAIQNTGPNKPKVRFFEGRKTILALYENEIFGKKKDIIGLVSMKDIRKMIAWEEEKGLLYLMKANSIYMREILEKSEESEEYLKEKNRLALGETKFLPQELHFDIDILVYENTVAMISPKTVIAVLIEDIAIANAQRQFLEFLWNTLPQMQV